MLCDLRIGWALNGGACFDRPVNRVEDHFGAVFVPLGARRSTFGALLPSFGLPGELRGALLDLFWGTFGTLGSGPARGGEKRGQKVA